MPSDALISVVMSVRNEERYIAAAIESILTQTNEELELIIIDDYSTDESAAICRSFKDPRVRFYSKTCEPRHLSTSRNVGIAMARGEYVTMQDADDVSEPTRLERQLELARRLGPRGVVGCSMKRIDARGTRIVRMPVAHDDIVRGFSRSYNRTTMVGGTVFARREILIETPYRSRFRLFEDWDQLLRLGERGDIRFANVDDPLYCYFIRKKGALFDPEWLEYNIFVRYCQWCRRSHRKEPADREELRKVFAGDPLVRVRWTLLAAAIAAAKTIRHSVAILG